MHNGRSTVQDRQETSSKIGRGWEGMKKIFTKVGYVPLYGEFYGEIIGRKKGAGSDDSIWGVQHL